MAAARMTKKEIRHDPVLESFQKGLDFTQHHGRWLVLGVVGIVVVVAVAVMVIQGRQTAAERAAMDMTQARAQVMRGQIAQARLTLEGLTSRHGGSEVASEAYLLLGDVHLATGQPAEARTSFEQALQGKGGPLLKRAAERGLATALDDLGDASAASLRYESAAGDEKSAGALSDLMNAARTARAAGDMERARGLYERCQVMAQDVSASRVSEILLILAELDAGGAAS